jgi:sulfatase modifying factor 1
VAVVAAMVLLATGAAQAVVIDTVTMGNPGNAADTRYATPGYGRVAYEYNIGKYEVTAGQYKEFLNAVAATDTYGLYNTSMSRTDYGSGIMRSGSSGNYAYSVDANFINRPVNYVSWGNAARFANWLHNGQPTGSQGLTTTEDGAYYLNGATSNAQLLAVSREADWKWAVTSEDEWYKAAYHKNDGVTGNYWDYPTSSNAAPGRDMADPLPGNNANYYGTPYPIDSGKYTTIAGEFQNSDSPYGTFDQGGNVWEWNEAIISGSYRGMRGGSLFLEEDYYLHAAHRLYNGQTSEGYSVGFRVSEVPEPATMSLLALGGLALVARRCGRK